MAHYPEYDTEATLHPEARDYWDSPTDAPAAGISGVSVVRAATNARLRIDVPVGCRLVTVRAIGNLPDQALPISFYLDGTWNQAMTVPVGVTSLYQQGIQLDGAHHVLELWLSFLQYAVQALLIYDVRGTGIRFLQPLPVTRIIAVYGDSIIGGGLAVPNTEFGVIPRLRIAMPTVSFAHESFSGRKLWDDSGSGGGQLGFATPALLADRLANLVQRGTVGDVMLAIGTNDCLSGPFTAGQFGTAYAALLDAIHTRLPSAHVYCQTPLITASSEGTMPPYRSQIVTVAAARSSFCSSHDGTAMVSVGNLADGIHPNNTGHGQYGPAWQAIL